MSRRYLIINADDFGLCESTNEAVEDIFEHGTITSTTLMTPCPYAQDAIHRTLKSDNMNVGLHLTFTAEWSHHKWGAVSSREHVQSILDGSGQMYSTVSEFSSHAEKGDVVAEMISQYNFLTSRGIEPTHADNHMGSLYGLTGVSFMKETLDFCAKTKLPFRLPKNRESLKRIVGVHEVPTKIVELHEQAVEYAKMLGVPLIDDLLTNTEPRENLRGYDDLKNAYMNIIASIGEGVSELYLHPSREDFSRHGRSWEVRMWEYRFLLDDDLRKHIEKEDIKLIGWRDVR